MFDRIKVAETVLNLIKKDFDKNLKVVFVERVYVINGVNLNEQSLVVEISKNNEFNCLADAVDLTFISSLLGEENKKIGNFIFKILYSFSYIDFKDKYYSNNNSNNINKYTGIIKCALSLMNTSKLKPVLSKELERLTYEYLHSYNYAITKFLSIYDKLLKLNLVPEYKFTNVPLDDSLFKNAKFAEFSSVSALEEDSFLIDCLTVLQIAPSKVLKTFGNFFYNTKPKNINLIDLSNFIMLVLDIDSIKAKTLKSWDIVYRLSNAKMEFLKYCCSVLAENPQVNPTDNI